MSPTNYQVDVHDPPYVRELAFAEQPHVRLQHFGPQALSAAELLANVLQMNHGLTLAEMMLAHFGSLRTLAAATDTELMKFRGVGRATVSRIRAALELGRRTCMPDNSEPIKVTSPGDCANLLMGEMMNLEQEQLRVVLLNTRNMVIRVVTLYQGTANTTHIRISEILRLAIRDNAVAIIVAHNHPTGDPSPSPEDVSVTRQIRAGCKSVDIELLDHIVIGRNRYVSLKERGLGFDS